MRYLRKWQLAFVCLLALAFLPFTPAPRGTAQAPGYTVTDLGTLGGDVSRAYGLDVCGRVVGAAQVEAGDFRPFRWSGGQGMIDLGTLGGQAGTAYAINQGDTTAGSALNAGGTLRAFVRPPAGPPQDIGSLGGSTVEAYDINASGQVVGVSEASDGGSLEDRAFVWQSGTGMQPVPAPSWGTPIRALGINDAGQIAGTAIHNVSGTHAFVTIGGVAKDLGTLGGTVSFATEVNDVGEVVGYSYVFSNNIPEPARAFYWKDTNGNGESDPGEMRDLGTLGGRNSYAQDINDSGLVVGRSETSEGSTATRAFIWRDVNSNGQSDAGEMQDLNSVVPGTGWTFQEAHAINDRGQIAGFGLNPQGKVHAFLLTPNNVGPSPCDATPTPTPSPGTLQFSAPTYTVGEGGGSAVISVTRTGGLDGAVSIDYATSNGTATASTSGNPGDYETTSGVLTFDPGVETRTFPVTINDDTLDEADETVNLTLSNPTGGATLGSRSTAVLTITDNDDPPTLSIPTGPPIDHTVQRLYEGAHTTRPVGFPVTLSAPSGQRVTVDYATSNGTAKQPGDYKQKSGTLIFEPGETTHVVTVEVVGDTLDEPDEEESFSVTLSSPTNATIGNGAVVVTVLDDDTEPTLQFNSATYEVVEGAQPGTVTITVARNGGSNGGVTVKYATSDGTAKAGSDYTATSGTLSFDENEFSKNFTIPITNDALDEADETVNLALSDAVGAALRGQKLTATLTIKDDNDPTPFFSVNDVAVNEGNSGTTAATFTVTLSAPSGQTVTVKYVSADGTANAGPDYGGTAGTLTFSPGETTKAVTVSAFGDTLHEPNETFFVNLSEPSNATIADGQGQGTINDDDAPTFRFSQASYSAGESAHFVTVTVERTGDPTSAVRVNFATSDGTASERRDYTAVSGRLQFAAGETSKSFDVLLTVDAYAESEETVNLTLSNPTGGAVLGGQSAATVNIQDTPPPGPNPIDIPSDFVRQHYHDFLNREPDASGLAFWTGQMTNCGNPNLEICRINVSAAFFQAIEFQQTGYLVYRTYKAAYGDATSPGVPGTVPVIRLNEFLPDTRIIGDGVIVGPPGWEERLEANKNAYMQEFVERQRFLDAYPLTMTAAEFVDKLNLNAGGVLSQGERDALVGDLSNGVKTRAHVLRAVAEDQQLRDNEFRRAFVLMQYYGYLRRNPDDAPERDLNFGGWKFWLDKLNDFNGNFVQAQMVKAFLDSIEYRTRFAP
jgi:probable HAF family extracellular repeat protein